MPSEAAQAALFKTLSSSLPHAPPVSVGQLLEADGTFGASENEAVADADAEHAVVIPEEHVVQSGKRTGNARAKRALGSQVTAKERLAAEVAPPKRLRRNAAAAASSSSKK